MPNIKLLRAIQLARGIRPRSRFDNGGVAEDYRVLTDPEPIAEDNDYTLYSRRDLADAPRSIDPGFQPTGAMRMRQTMRNMPMGDEPVTPSLFDESDFYQLPRPKPSPAVAPLPEAKEVGSGRIGTRPSAVRSPVAASKPDTRAYDAARAAAKQAWERYNESEDPADFVRASNAMLAMEKAAKAPAAVAKSVVSGSRPSPVMSYAPTGGQTSGGSLQQILGKANAESPDSFKANSVPILYGYDPNFVYGRSATQKQQPFNNIVLHHSTGNINNLVKYGQRVDPQRGGAFGYHFYIDRDGKVIQGAPMSKRTNHIKPVGHTMRKDKMDISNANSVGVSLVNAEKGATAAQRLSAEKVVRALMQQYGISAGNIVGHGELQKDRMATEGQLARLFRDTFREAGGRVGYATEGAVVADTASAPATREQIQDLYQTRLGREADTGGLNYWDSTDLSYNDLMPHFYEASMGSGQSTANNAYQPLAGYLEAQTAYNRSLMQGQPIGDIVSQKGQYLGYNQNSQNAINNYLKNNEITPGTITGSMGEFSANDARNLAAMMYGEARSGFGVKTDDDAAAEAWNRATNYLQGNMQDALEPYKNITNFNKASEDYNRRVAERAGTNLSNFNQLGGHSFFTYGNEADRLSKFNEIPYPPPRPPDLSFNMPAVGSNETFGTYEFNPLGDVSFATPGYEFNPLGEVSFATPSYDNFTVGLDTSYKSMPTFTNLSVNPSDYGGFSGSGNLGGASGLNIFSTDLNDYSNAGLNLGYGGNSWDGFGGWGAESYFADGGAAKGGEEKELMQDEYPTEIAKEVKPEGVQYVTRQEGPFYRVERVMDDTRDTKVVQSSGQPAGAIERGVRSDPGDVPGGAGKGVHSAQTKAPQTAQPVSFTRPIAEEYTLTTQGKPLEIINIPESSIEKQAAIGLSFMMGTTGNPAYKEAIFNAYKSKMPEVIAQSEARNYDELLAASYRQMAKETAAQFDALPLKFSFYRNAEGAYPNSKAMAKDVNENKHLAVFQGGDEHAFLKNVDPVTGLNENEKFRAVHDAFGHAVLGNQFGPKGEEIAWMLHQQMYSPLARLAMTAETRGQNSVVNYTPLNAALRSKISEIDGKIQQLKWMGKKSPELEKAKTDLYAQWQYAPQTPVLLPPEFLSPTYSGGMPSYVSKLVRPEKETSMSSPVTHFSEAPGLTKLDPKMYGTGIAGDEASRLKTANDIRNRSYFYLGTPETVKPEPGLGANIYTGKASRLYDLTKDPLGLSLLAHETSRTPFSSSMNPGVVDAALKATRAERLAKLYGYSGVANPKAAYPMASIFRPLPVTWQGTSQRKYKQGGEVKELLQDEYPTEYMPEVGRQVMADGGETAQPERDVSPLGFYSHAAETAQNFPQAKGTPDQFRSMLLNSGVKPAEIEHSGYDEAFAGKPSVTREDVAQHFSERMPQIEETILGGPSEVIFTPEMEKRLDELTEKRIALGLDKDEMAEKNKLFSLQEEARRGTTPTKYQDYTLPGGKNYREVLLRTPHEKKQRVGVTSTGDIFTEEELANPVVRRTAEKIGLTMEDRMMPTMKPFRSTHWDEPNVLAHIRMSDRTGPDGEKILHLEELQSDWGQEGKKEGFKHPGEPAGLSADETARFRELINIPQIRRTPAQQTELDALNATGDRRLKALPSAPYVTSTQGWTDLGLKRVLKEAAEGGYDKVVWTPGVEQAKRYNLADQKGMKGYYDNILPKALQKLVSKHDKEAKVGIKGSLPNKDGDLVPAMGIDITPKMRESIMRGQSAFADGGEVNGYARGGLLTREDTELQRRLKKILREDDVDPERAAEFARVRGTYEMPVHERGAYSKRVLPMEAQDVTTNIGPLGNARPKVAPQMSWNDFHKIGKGGTIFTLGGDRSNLGRLTHINGKPLAWSVDLHAGTKYMLEPNEGAVWANDQGAATALRNNILEAAEKGPVYGAFAPMAPTAVDSSVNMFEALMAQIPGAGLSKKDAKKFDDSLKAGEHIKGTGDDAERTRGKRIQELDKWPGILNAEAASDFARTISGAHRAAIVKHMEAAPWQKMGFPSVGITRAAITDPELLSTSGNMMGHHIVELDPSKYDRDRLAFEHSTYPVPTSGKIVGKVPLIERQVAMPDYAEKSVMDPAIHKKGALKGEPLIIHPYSPNPLGRSSWRGNTELRQGIQPINDRMLESIQEVHGSDFADGGEVPPATGPIQRRQIPVSQSPIVDRALMVSSRSAPTLPGAPFLSRQLRGRPVS